MVVVLTGCKECGCTGVAHVNAEMFYNNLIEAHIKIRKLEQKIKRLQHINRRK